MQNFFASNRNFSFIQVDCVWGNWELKCQDNDNQTEVLVAWRTRNMTKEKYTGKPCEGNSTETIPWSSVCKGRISLQYLIFQMRLIDMIHCTHITIFIPNH